MIFPLHWIPAFKMIVRQTTLKVAGQALSHTVSSTGKTVGEPKQDWVIDNFKSTRLGKINFPESGTYKIKLEILPGKDEVVKFQCVWIK